MINNPADIQSSQQPEACAATSNQPNQPPWQQQQPPPYPVPIQQPYQQPSMYPGVALAPAYGYPQQLYPHLQQQKQQQQQQPQQQQQVVFITANTNAVTVVPAHQVESFWGQIIFSSLVFLFCNFLFGMIGFMLAGVASVRATVDPKSANQLGKASWGVSVSGMLITMIIVAVVVGVSLSSDSSTSSSNCNYYYSGTCYRYKLCSVYSSSTCYSYSNYGSYYYNSDYGCCYHN